MKKLGKLIVFGGIILAAAIAVVVLATAPLTVELEVLEEKTADVSFTVQGLYTFEQVLDVYPQITGEVSEILVEEGEAVAAGDPLAVVNADDVEFEIRQLESEIKGLQAQSYNLAVQEQRDRDVLQGTRGNLVGQLASLESEIIGQEEWEESRQQKIALQESIVMRDQSNAALARRTLKEYRDDYDVDIRSGDPEYNALYQAVNDAEKQLAASEQVLLDLQSPERYPGYNEGRRESLEAQLAGIDVQLGKYYSGSMQSYYAAQIESLQVKIEQLNSRQGRATVTVSEGGIVCELPVKDVNLITGSSVIARIGVAPAVEAFVPVREIGGLAVGDDVSLTVQMRTGDIQCAGKITMIDSQAKTMLSTLGVEESKVRVLIQPDGNCLGIGYQVDVTFTVYREENRVMVPRKALFERDGEDCVFVMQQGIAALRPVVKGIETRDGYVITEGLAAGETVILDANIKGLAEGVKVAG